MTSSCLIFLSAPTHQARRRCASKKIPNRGNHDVLCPAPSRRRWRAATPAAGGNEGAACILEGLSQAIARLLPDRDQSRRLVVRAHLVSADQQENRQPAAPAAGG